MSGNPQRTALYMTRDEYFAFDDASEGRYEFHNGRVIEMMGATPSHARICSNLHLALGRRLGDSPCSAFDASVRVFVEAAQRGLYPDVLVVCGTPQLLQDSTGTSIINPSLVFEVLSPSTEILDRGEKLWAYMQIPTLREYVLLEQDCPRIVTYRRSEDAVGKFAFAAELSAVLELESLDLTLPLSDIYQGVDFPDSAAAH